MDHARVEARKIERLKTALKSKINPSLDQSYHFGQAVWLKVQSSHKFLARMERLPLDHIVPADECHDAEEETETAPDDAENDERLEDDSLESV